jgi:nucleoid DNA-binding protein
MNLNDLVQSIQVKTGIDVATIQKTLGGLSEVIADKIARGKSFEIKNFGKYTIVPPEKKNKNAQQTQENNAKRLDLKKIPNKVLNLIPKHICQQFQVVPIEKKLNSIVVAMVDPNDQEAIIFLTKRINKNMEIVPCSQNQLDHFLSQYA